MSRGRVVRWMLEEVGEPYETTILEMGTTLNSDSYRAINPMMKVPSIKHGDIVVTECAAICAYLADAFPDKHLAPPQGERGSYYRWLFFAAGPIEQSCVNTALGFEVPQEREGMVGYGTLARVVETLDSLLERQAYVTGDQFSAADVYLGAQLQWNMEMGVIEHRKSFIDYTKRVHDRPACVRAVQIDDDWLAKNQ